MTIFSKHSARVACFLVTLLTMATPQAFAGWAGGGGELLKNINNPWFLDNTPIVTYCVNSGANFSLRSAQSSQLVDKAIAAWKTELAKVVDTAQPIFPRVRVLVGTQEFRRVQCDGSEDLAIQLGVLTSEQKAYLGQYRRYVGAAIRTEYDEVNLKGRGFIFLASDLGAERYEGEAPAAFWSADDGLPVYRVLLHELGHVFGVPHLDLYSHPIGIGANVMDADGPEKIAAGEQAVWPFDTEAPLAILTPLSKSGALCKTVGAEVWPLHRFLEVPNSFKCIKLEKQGNRYRVLIRENLDSSNAPFKDHASIYINKNFDPEYKTAISVKITPVQKVFDIDGPVYQILKYLPGPGFIKSKIAGTLMIIGSRTAKPVMISEGFSSAIELSGILDGQLNPDLYRLTD